MVSLTIISGIIPLFINGILLIGNNTLLVQIRAYPPPGRLSITRGEPVDPPVSSPIISGRSLVS